MELQERCIYFMQLTIGKLSQVLHISFHMVACYSTLSRHLRLLIDLYRSLVPKAMVDPNNVVEANGIFQAPIPPQLLIIGVEPPLYLPQRSGFRYGRGDVLYPHLFESLSEQRFLPPCCRICSAHPRTF